MKLRVFAHAYIQVHVYIHRRGCVMYHPHARDQFIHDASQQFGIMDLCVLQKASITMHCCVVHSCRLFLPLVLVLVGLYPEHILYSVHILLKLDGIIPSPDVNLVAWERGPSLL